MVMTLQQIEEELRSRIGMMERVGGYEWSEELACYNALVQVKQAQALESIDKNLDTFRISGLPVENVGGH